MAKEETSFIGDRDYQWKHKTAIKFPDKIVGYVLTDEAPGVTGIYAKGANGELWPARTIHTDKKAYNAVCQAWMDKPGYHEDRRAGGKMHKLANGQQIPVGFWHKVGKNFSIKPLRSTFQLRNDKTGEVVRATRRPNAHDAMMMGLYHEALPAGFIEYCFGADALEDEPGPFYTPWKGVVQKRSETKTYNG